MPVKLLTSGGGGVNLVPSSSIASDQTLYLPTSGTSGGTVLCTDSSGGTANGVLYLNGSKQVTSGSGLVFDSSGNLGIGTASPAQLLHIKKDQAAYTWGRIDNQNSSGSAYSGLMLGASGNSWGISIGSSAANSNALCFVIDAGGGNNEKMRLDTSGNAYNKTGVWGTISSDIRYKENIIDATPKLADVCSLRVVNFNYSADESKTKCLGFIAQEMEQIFPALVNTTDNRKYDEDGNVISGYEDSKGLKTGLDFAILVKAIQEQQAIIESQAQTIESLTQRIEALEYTK